MSRVAMVLLVLVVLLGSSPAQAQRRTAREAADALVDIARKHRTSLDAAIPRREREARETAAALDRSSTLYARGLITRDELQAAAREAGHARASLERAKQELVRADALLAELEARRRFARLPPLRPGQYDAGADFVRFSGRRAFSLAQLRPLEAFFVARAGRRLPVSAMGQSDVHTRLGLDHRHAVDLALHPDSAEGRWVLAWLRERDIPFLAFRGALAGSATGAHIHVGAPSERFAAPRPRRPADTAGGARTSASRSEADANDGAPAPATRLLTR